MKTYLFFRIRSFAVVLSVLAVLLLAASALIPVLSIKLAIVFLAVAPLIHMKKPWYLLLPYSRKQLLYGHFIESILLSLVTALFMTLIFLIDVLVLGKGGFEASGIFANFIVLVVLFLFRLLLPMAAVNPGANGIHRGSFSQKTVFKRLGLVGLSWVLIFGGKSEPWVWGAILSIAIAFVPSVPMASLIYPRLDLKRLYDAGKKWSVILFLTITSLALAGVYLTSPHKLVGYAVAYFGRIPLPIGNARMKEIVFSDVDQESPLMRRMVNRVKSDVSFEDWKERTLKCKSNSCLNIGSEFSAEDEAKSQKLDRLEVLMSLCQPGPEEDNVIRCQGPKMSRANIWKWLVLMDEAETLEAWLKDPSVTKQYVAIRSVADKVTTDQQNALISELTKSQDPSIAEIARLHLNFYLPNAQKNSKASYCRCDLF